MKGRVERAKLQDIKKLSLSIEKERELNKRKEKAGEERTRRTNRTLISPSYILDKIINLHMCVCIY